MDLDNKHAPLKEIIISYLEYYARGDTHTARAKQNDLRCFQAFLSRYLKLPENKEPLIQDWDFSSTQAFVDASLRKGEAPTTVARRLATLKHMGRSFAERTHGFINPARDVKPPKIRTLKPKSLSSDEASTLQQDLIVASEKSQSQFNELRNRTIVALFLATGLRADEVRTLRMKQIEKDGEWLNKVRTKGNQFRRVYVAFEVRPLLAAYLAVRKIELDRFWKLRNKREEEELPLFVSGNRSKPGNSDSFFLGAKTLWRIVKNFSRDTPLHPHLLRHTFAAGLLESSKDIRLVAQALGHSDVRVTMRYTERTDEDIAEAVEKTRQKSKVKK